MPLIVPAMVAVSLVAMLASFYYFDLGARKVLHIADGESSIYVAVSLLLQTFLSMLAGGLLSALGLT